MKKSSRLKLGLVAAMVSAAGLAQPALAADFPNQPIRFVTPYPAGGSHSLHAGVITSTAEESFGQPMISVIRPGGGGAVAAAEVARGKADGYTLLFGDPTINSLRPQIEKLPYKVDDFVAVARINYAPAIFVTSPAQPFDDIKGMVDWAKANPGKFVFSSDNVNGFTYTVFELLKARTGATMRGVELGGGGPAVTQLLGGNTMAYAGDSSVVGEHIKSGTLVALCVADTERVQSLPDVPTCIEEGFDVSFQFWRGVLAPKGTPEDVIATLSESFGKLVEDEGFLRLMGRIASDVQFLDHEAFAAALKEEQKTLAEAYGVKP